jgi:GMP synthase-like glutamine amidotransferase
VHILVFQHLTVEHPGAFRDLWAAAGHTVTTVDFERGDAIPEFDGYHLMVVMGGPMDVWEEDAHPWMVEEKVAIRRWVRDLAKPYLGICLGHQLLADALGGVVGRMAAPEVGLHPVELTAAGMADPLLGGLPPRLETFQWHGAEVKELPDGSEVLATSAACPVQAFRWERHAYGFQYHCEITARTVAEWNEVEANRSYLVRVLGGEAAARLEADVAARLPALQATARTVDANLPAVLAAGA